VTAVFAVYVFAAIVRDETVDVTFPELVHVEPPLVENCISYAVCPVVSTGLCVNGTTNANVRAANAANDANVGAFGAANNCTLFDTTFADDLVGETVVTARTRYT
jgi:hypothetical protein